MNLKKRGLSPVIATVLLISLSLALAIIVFFWARSFIAERVQKQGQEIGAFCEQTVFNVEAVKDATNNINIYLTNTGNVPIYGIEVRSKKIGEVAVVETFVNKNIYAGESGNVVIGDSTLAAGEVLAIVPILLGETNEYRKPYVCDKEYGIDVEIK